MSDSIRPDGWFGWPGNGPDRQSARGRNRLTVRTGLVLACLVLVGLNAFLGAVAMSRQGYFGRMAVAQYDQARTGTGDAIHARDDLNRFVRTWPTPHAAAADDARDDLRAILRALDVAAAHALTRTAHLETMHIAGLIRTLPDAPDTATYAAHATEAGDGLARLIAAYANVGDEARNDVANGVNGGLWPLIATAAFAIGVSVTLILIIGGTVLVPVRGGVAIDRAGRERGFEDRTPAPRPDDQARVLRALDTIQESLGENIERMRGEHEAEAARLREREQQAAEESRTKSVFLAMMGHEVRTPMNAVLGLTGSLLDMPLQPDQRRVVETIHESGSTLMRIINDILDFTRLDTGKMTFENQAFEPAMLARSVLSMMRPAARAKDLTFEIEVESGLPALVMGDAGRIRQVLLNLATNAVKFTETGGVTIATRCTGAADGQAALEWEVRDTGIGLTADRFEDLFSEFMQADNSIARRFEGTGLGLAISKRLIDQMGGTIAVRARAGAGTVFHIRLELPVTDALPRGGAKPANAGAELMKWQGRLGRKLRILFAEDNPTNQFVARHYFKDLNVHLDLVANGREAVDAVCRVPYDVVCMDMNMPEMDGLTATREIRARGGHFACMPIIALTANAFAEDVQACLDAGMNQFVRKPVDKEMLLSVILDALPVTGMAMPMPPKPAEAVDPHIAACDLKSLGGLADDIGEEGVAELIGVFERETVARFARMRKDGTGSARELHALKGAAGTVCAARLAHRAAALEQRLTAGGGLTADDLTALETSFEAFGTALRAARPGLVEDQRG